MKKIVYLITFLMLTFSAIAQDSSDSITRYEINRFKDNWFFGVAGGINIYNGGSKIFSSLDKRIAPSLDITVGKWITPSSGIRFQYAGIKANNYAKMANSGYSTSSTENEYGKINFNVMNLHVDLMWNPANSIWGHKDRFCDFVAFAGGGYARSWTNNNYDNEVVASVGFVNNFEVSNRFDITFEGRHMFVNSYFDKDIHNASDNMTSLSVGVSIKIGKSKFKKVSYPNYTPYKTTISELKAKNRQFKNARPKYEKTISKLKSENEALKNKISSLEKNESTSTAAPVALFFKINKAVLSPEELNRLEFYVTEWMKQDYHKKKMFILIGSADKKTGPKDFNQKISEKRINYISNLLVNKYKISKEYLTLKAEGDSNNRFSGSKFNRAVIIE